MKYKTGYHLAWDLFAGAKKWEDLPRFYIERQRETSSAYIPHSTKYKPISWKEYAAKVKALAGYLAKNKIKIKDKVAILGQNSFNWCVAYNAIHTIRGVVVPIYPASQPDTLQYFFTHSDARLLFCDSSFLANIKNLDLAKIETIVLLDSHCTKEEVMVQLGSPTQELKPVVFEQALEQGKNYNTEEILNSAKTEDIATIIYTSGTTGLPKGVMLTHGNLEGNAADWITLNSPMIPENAVDLHWLPLSHTFGIGVIMLGNVLGWQSYFAATKDVMDKFTTVRPHVFISVPAYWEKLYNQIKAYDSKDMKLAFDAVTGGRLVFALSGGAGLKKEIKEGFYKVGLLIIEGYGLTETSPTLTMNRKDKFNFDSVGIPYPSVSLKLAEDGEILAKGPNIFVGYYKDEKSTKESFTDDGWFKTGDVGQWLDGGFLKIIDRKKEIIVTSGGKNIPPQNIERLFQDNPYIQHLVVYGDGKKYLTALVTLKENEIRKELNDNNTTWENLVSFDSVKTLVETQIQEVNKTLASYETIKKFLICPKPLSVEDNLLTASLKIRRKAIYKQYVEMLDVLYK